MRASSVYSGTAPAQVVFTVQERCLPGKPAGNNCDNDQFTISHPEYWPDTPVDLHCKDGADCTNHSPSFWSRKRLTQIETRVQVAGATRKVDRYDLVHDYPDNGDHAPTLWLESIKHTGLNSLGGASANASMPEVVFTPEQLPNRVGTIPGLRRLYYHRIGIVTSETGAETTVGYSKPDCSSVPRSDRNDEKDKDAQEFASTNTTGCFPVYWTPVGQWRPEIDWFYTYPVKWVRTIDKYNAYQDGTQPTLLTEYTYRGDPGWHYDDTEVVKAKYRTWGQFRGYQQVDVTTGDTSVFHYNNGRKIYDRKTKTSTYYFRGMDKDTLPDDRKRSAPPLTSAEDNISVEDANELAGQVFKTVTYNGDGGEVAKTTVSVPTVIGPTASRERTGLPPLQATMVRTGRSITREKVSYGWRKTEATTFYNTKLGQSTTGMPVQSVDLGEAGSANNITTCTFNRYLEGAVPTLVVAAEVLTTSQNCSSPGATPSGTLISHVRTSYDGKPFAYDGDGQTNVSRPAKGNPTLLQEATTASGAKATAFVDLTATTYDSYGRAVTTTRTPGSKDAGGTSLAQTSYTAYTPASGALPTGITSTVQVTPGADCSAVTQSSTDCHRTTQTVDPARQQITEAVDAAGSLTSTTYDALGRTTKVWLPNKNKAAGAPANVVFDYRLSKTGPSVVTSERLQDDEETGGTATYTVGKVLYDAMLRKIESQDTGENGSVVVSDTQYDSHGRKVWTNNAYAAAGSPSNTLISDRLSQVSIPSSTVTDHDGLGRVTQVTELHKGVEKWKARTAHTGDTTTVIPPTGGIATTTTVSARNQVTKLQHYTTAPTLNGSLQDGFTATGGASNDTVYKYTAAGHQSSVTAPDGASWTYSYDLRGRNTARLDPDTGSNTTTYDDAGNISLTRDARNIQLAFSYDLLGRRLDAINKTKDNFKYATWTYDTLRIGKPTSSTRHVKDVTGGYTVAVTGYSKLGNPYGQTISLPSAEAPLPLTYTTNFAYTPNNELLAQQREPAVGGLPGETITYSHNALGTPTRTAGAELYVADSLYTDFGQPSLLRMGASTNQAEATYAYDEHTMRMTGRSISRSQGIGPLIDELSYTYDDAGNPLSVTNRQIETGNAVTDTQCYRYDTLKRLRQAWTADAACPSAATAQPAAGTTATGAGAYWQSFTYDKIGNRTEMVEHSINGGADTTITYRNGCDTTAVPSTCNRTGAQPHTLTEISGGADPTKFVYDTAGNLLRRTPTTGSGTGQTLSWDDEGNLAEVNTAGSAPTTTKYVYDANGAQLIRRDPGRTTLFAGSTQVVIDTAVTPAASLGAVRTYSHGGGGAAVAVRSTLPGGGTHYLFNEPNGTATLSMDTTTQEVSRQQYKPYGEPRGNANPKMWPDMTRGYLGAPKNTATGYTDLGARKYDPVLGRFISADPLFMPGDINQIGGYNYASSNPVAGSDPTGTENLDVRQGYIGREEFNEKVDDIQDGNSGGGDNGGGNNGGGSSGGSSGGSGGGSNVGANTKTGTATKPPKFAEYAIIVTGHCLGDNNTMPHDCHITDLDSGEINRAFGRYICEYYGDCTLKKASEAATERQLLELWSYIPYVGIPATVQLAKQDWDEGNYASLAIQAASLLPAGKLIGKFAKSCNSFDPNTLVLMADGSTKPISDIKIGDQVLATDPETGQTTAKPVTHLHKNLDTDLADLAVIDEDGVRQVIQTTQEHPFWNASSQHWTHAEDLSPDVQLKTVDGRRATVQSPTPFVFSKYMHDLTVADVHTYYVLAGTTPVLVHNCGDLVGDAAKFPGAHVLDEHVNLTPQQAIKLAQKKGGRNSVFIDEQTALQVTDYALAEKSGMIKKWLKGSDQQLSWRGKFGAPNSIGTVYRADGTSSPTGNGYFIILQRAKGHRGGYYVHSSYPE